MRASTATRMTISIGDKTAKIQIHFLTQSKNTIWIVIAWRWVEKNELLSLAVSRRTPAAARQPRREGRMRKLTRRKSMNGLSAAEFRRRLR